MSSAGGRRRSSSASRGANGPHGAAGTRRSSGSTPLPLAHVVAYVDASLDDGADNSQGVAKRITQLGGQVRAKWCAALTHLVWRGGREEYVLKARSQEILIVAPSWVHQCEAEGRHLPETSFLPEDLPELSLGELVQPHRAKRTKLPLRAMEPSSDKVQKLPLPTDPCFTSSQPDPGRTGDTAALLDDEPEGNSSGRGSDRLTPRKSGFMSIVSDGMSSVMRRYGGGRASSTGKSAFAPAATSFSPATPELASAEEDSAASSTDADGGDQTVVVDGRMWACGACTLMNEESVKRCVVCHARRPPTDDALPSSVLQSACTSAPAQIDQLDSLSPPPSPEKTSKKLSKVAGWVDHAPVHGTIASLTPVLEPSDGKAPLGKEPDKGKELNASSSSSLKVSSGKKKRKRQNSSEVGAAALSAVAVDEDGGPQIALSALKSDARMTLMEVAKTLSAQVVASDDPSLPCTHLVMGDDGRRTLKVLFALCSGARIVYDSWILSSMEAGKWADTSEHKSLRYCKEAPVKPLSGMEVHIGPFSNPPRRIVEKLARAAGATCCSKVNPSCVCIVQANEDGRAWAAAQSVGAEVRTAAWLFDSIENGAALPPSMDDKEYSLRAAGEAELPPSQGF
jgi:hypothetical protein